MSGAIMCTRPRPSARALITSCSWLLRCISLASSGPSRKMVANLINRVFGCEWVNCRIGCEWVNCRNTDIIIISFDHAECYGIPSRILTPWMLVWYRCYDSQGPLLGTSIAPLMLCPSCRRHPSSYLCCRCPLLGRLTAACSHRLP